MAWTTFAIDRCGQPALLTSRWSAQGSFHMYYFHPSRMLGHFLILDAASERYPFPRKSIILSFRVSPIFSSCTMCVNIQLGGGLLWVVLRCWTASFFCFLLDDMLPIL